MGVLPPKTGDHARILEADVRLASYFIEQLGLPDPAGPVTRKRGREGRSRDHTSGSARRTTSRRSPRDRRTARQARLMPGTVARGPQPSCSVGTSPEQGWCCHSGNCGARGAIYDLASVLLGGPWGHDLRGEAFKRARAYGGSVFDELSDHPQRAKEER